MWNRDNESRVGKMNDNNKIEEMLAREIASMSDTEVESNVSKFFRSKPLENNLENCHQEIFRLRTLCLRAAEEIKELDEKLESLSPSPEGTHTSINLLSRLEGRIGGSYE